MINGIFLRNQEDITKAHDNFINLLIKIYFCWVNLARYYFLRIKLHDPSFGIFTYHDYHIVCCCDINDFFKFIEFVYCTLIIAE